MDFQAPENTEPSWEAAKKEKMTSLADAQENDMAGWLDNVVLKAREGKIIEM